MRRLSELNRGECAIVASVSNIDPRDPIAARIRDLGFVAGEAIEVLGLGPGRGGAMLIGIAGTRFALRRSEAERVVIGDAAR